MGNPETSVVDEFGRTHDICSLFACDDSVMPTQGSANPVLPIMALVAPMADYVVTQGNEIFSSEKRSREKPAVRRNLPPPGTKPHSLAPSMTNASDADANQQHTGRYPAMHPAIIHFPIVSFLLTALFLILWFWRDNIFFLNAAYWTFMFPALGAVVAGGTGFLDYYNASYPEHAEEDAAKASKQHIHLGVAITIMTLIGAVYFLIEKPINDLALVKWFVIISFVEALLVIIQGFLGGRLVYKYHYGIEPRHQQAS